MKLHIYKIIGTHFTIYEAYEPYDGHSSIMTLEGKKMGRVGSRRLPKELESLPARSDIRVEAVTAWQYAQYEEAYDFIFSCCPKLKGVGVSKSMGSIETYSVD